jgi:predicted AlkP superfamily pyrophosphatase or phosphodiesterase
VEQWFGTEWTRLLPSLDYDAWSGRDDVLGEGIGYAQGRTFPHPLTGGLKQPGRAYYEAFTFSPFANDVLFELSKRAVEHEQLGRRDIPDLLCVSLSSNDLIGHVWGPDSHEVLDVALRTDRALADFLSFLDKHVGTGRYLVALTSDHGVCPLPELAKAQGKDAGRIDLAKLIKSAEQFLSERFHGGRAASWFEPVVSLWVDLKQQTLKAAGADAAEVAQALADWLRAYPGIEAVYTRAQIERSLAPSDALGTRIKRSYMSGRCGDLFVVPKPYHLFASTYWTGTTHGSPHAYDTHVPLLFAGPGIPPTGRHDQAVTPLCAASVVARGLGINGPKSATDPVPDGLFASK